MSKFKPGDEIVVVNADSFHFGNRGVIDYWNRYWKSWSVTVYKKSGCLINEEEMELAEVYDSPLGKALR